MGFRQFRPHILSLHEKANAVWANEMLCVLQQPGEGSTGPGRYHVKGTKRRVFHAQILDLDGQAHAGHSRIEEITFFGRRLEKTDGNPASQHRCQDQTRKASARAQIGQGTSRGRDEGRQLGRIPEMPSPKIRKRRFGDKVVPGVPFFQQSSIGFQPCQCFT